MGRSIEKLSDTACRNVKATGKRYTLVDGGGLYTETTFEGVAREWFSREQKRWVDSHADRILRRLERDIFPWIGGRPVA